MSGRNMIGSLLNGHLLFLQQFLKHPLQVGSIIPSSRFMERHIVEAARVASADVVVELGPGTGGTTRAILSAMPRHGRLLSIEINPDFHAMVSRIKDDRIIAHLGSACELSEILNNYHLPRPNAIISGIPFSTMSRDDGIRILQSVSSVLAPNGRFVAYQFRNRVANLCPPLLEPGPTTTELLNIPPMRVFQWRKPPERVREYS